MNKLMLFIDAALQPVTGVTSVAYVRVDEQGKVKTRAKVVGKNNTTQRGELFALIYALRGVSNDFRQAFDIIVYTDCAVTQKRIESKWFRADYDLWHIFNQQARIHNVTVYWLKRNSHPYHQMAHNLARDTLRQYLSKNR